MSYEVVEETSFPTEHEPRRYHMSLLWRDF
jgi:hypothetical protein